MNETTQSSSAIPSEPTINETIEHVARTAYGRLVAILAKQNADIAAAEDALADAFAQALKNWGPETMPSNPEGWLLTVARNRHKDRLRSHAHKTSVAGDTLDQMERRSEPAIAQTMDMIESLDPDAIRDERLKLMFVCAHEAIDPNIRTPLMLQTVLGLNATTIATAYAVPSAAMAQRLVRAKAKIKQAGIAFQIPQSGALDDRLDSVLEAIYGAYCADWQGIETKESLAAEALFLSKLMVELMPDDPECLGLGALLWFSQARLNARIDDEGCLVPLSEQDTALWDRLAMRRAQVLLQRAFDQKSIGRFQLEAALQSVHCARSTTGKTDWMSILALYEGLMRHAPTLGAAVARAAAIGNTHGAQAGLLAMDRITLEHSETFQPAWATRAHLLAQLDQYDEAKTAFDRAIALTTNLPARRYLEKQRNGLVQSAAVEKT